MYYLNARYYNPKNYSFITQDSYRGEQKEYNTWNLYAYCGENPINYVDPSGHKREKIYGVYLEVKRKKNDKEKTKYVVSIHSAITCSISTFPSTLCYKNFSCYFIFKQFIFTFKLTFICNFVQCFYIFCFFLIVLFSFYFQIIKGINRGICMAVK